MGFRLTAAESPDISSTRMTLLSPCRTTVMQAALTIRSLPQRGPQARLPQARPRVQRLPVSASAGSATRDVLSPAERLKSDRCENTPDLPLDDAGDPQFMTIEHCCKVTRQIQLSSKPLASPLVSSSSSDRDFYAFPRIVKHVDDGFLRQLTELYRQVRFLRPGRTALTQFLCTQSMLLPCPAALRACMGLQAVRVGGIRSPFPTSAAVPPALRLQRIPAGADVLDLCSSWVSHLPDDVKYGKVRRAAQIETARVFVPEEQEQTRDDVYPRCRVLNRHAPRRAGGRPWDERFRAREEQAAGESRATHVQF